jgi:hypothetical protein
LFYNYLFLKLLTPNDHECLREAAPHHLGEGMALSYYCGYLKFLLFKTTHINRTKFFSNSVLLNSSLGSGSVFRNL